MQTRPKFPLMSTRPFQSQLVSLVSARGARTLKHLVFHDMETDSTGHRDYFSPVTNERLPGGKAELPHNDSRCDCLPSSR
jgi:hypothetical protein